MLKWGLGFLCVMVCVGLTLHITRQRSELQQLEEAAGHPRVSFNREEDRGSNRKVYKTSLMVRVHEAQLTLSARRQLLLRLEADVEVKQTELVKCKESLNVTIVGKEAKEKELPDTEAAQRTEAESWRKEMEKLKEDLEAKSPVCDHLKDDPEARKLCGIEEKKEEEKKEEKKEEEKKEEEKKEEKKEEEKKEEEKKEEEKKEEKKE